jgi:hypothetical protein
LIGSGRTSREYEKVALQTTLDSTLSREREFEKERKGNVRKLEAKTRPLHGIHGRKKAAPPIGDTSKQFSKKKKPAFNA